jgi:hypothetical protein
LSRDANSPMQFCKQWSRQCDAVRKLTLTYGKQDAIVKYGNMGDTRGNLKPNLNIYYLNKSATFKYRG